MPHHGAQVARKSRVVQCGRQRIRAAAIAHVHADHVEAGLPGSRRDALHVAGIRGTLKAMHQHQSEPPGLNLLSLPVAMAQDHASVRRVHLDGFRHAGNAKRRTGKIIPHNGLQVPVAQAAARLEIGEPLSQAGRVRVNPFVS